MRALRSLTHYEASRITKPHALRSLTHYEASRPALGSLTPRIRKRHAAHCVYPTACNQSFIKPTACNDSLILHYSYCSLNEWSLHHSYCSLIHWYSIIASLMDHCINEQYEWWRDERVLRGMREWLQGFIQWFIKAFSCNDSFIIDVRTTLYMSAKIRECGDKGMRAYRTGEARLVGRRARCNQIIRKE